MMLILNCQIAEMTCPGIFGPFITGERPPGWWNGNAFWIRLVSILADSN